MSISAKRLRQFLAGVRYAAATEPAAESTAYVTKGDLVWTHGRDGDDVARAVTGLLFKLDAEVSP